MKNSKYLLFFLFSVSTCFWSCEESIDLNIDPEDFELHLVVNEFFDPGSPWSIEVTSSFFVGSETENNPEPIVDASVKIYNEDNEFIYELFHEGNGIYSRDDYAPDVNRRYSILVTHKDYKPVTATSYVPEISTIKINDYNVVTEDEDEGIEVDFQIENVSNVNAYYVWEIVSLENKDGGSSPVVDPLSDSFLDGLKGKFGIPKDRKEVIGVGVMGDGTYNTTYNTLDGSRWQGNGKDDSPDEINPTDVNPGEVDQSVLGEDLVENTDGGDGGTNINNFRYELRVVSISEELFNYYKSIEELDPNNTPSSVGNPFLLYTNINDGLGIFAGFHESSQKF